MKTPREKNGNAKRQAETVTCPHCRYERPAKDEHCHICGYPWPWIRKKQQPPTSA